MTGAQAEIKAGNRFEFGKNWSQFLHTLDDEKISAARRSLAGMLGVESMQGLRFLDAGSGSGLFSLAARQLGAAVVSFDYDPASVNCAGELRKRYFPNDPSWQIKEGSVLDRRFVEELGLFDIVYSWGVLHHTGEMWKALDLIGGRVKPNGQLFVSIYNDQGGSSMRWRSIKRTYNKSSPFVRAVMLRAFSLFFQMQGVLSQLARLGQSAGKRPSLRLRGMSRWSDLVDWIGGYPFEVAKPEDIFDFCRARDFELRKLKTCGAGHGCNEFVFKRL